MGGDGTVTDTITTDSEWYKYIDQGTYLIDGKTSIWANAKSADSSQWVWIPRFAYKIPRGAYTNIASEIDVVFLKGTSDDYYDETGNKIGTAKRVGQGDSVGISEYLVHPAFTNETTSSFANGGWDTEITGMWVAKYEAGFANLNNEDSFWSEYTVKIPATDTKLTYSEISYANNIYANIVTNNTKIKYPVFVPGAYSYNCINQGDAYLLAKELNSTGNPYGFDNKVDPHMIKNSEWGAVAYLTHSKYGRNGKKTSINTANTTIEGSPIIYAKTGYLDNDTWYNTNEGAKVSTTGNISGIYDLSGGFWEFTTGYINEPNEEQLTKYARNMTVGIDGKIIRNSTKYISVYNIGATNIQLDNYNEERNKVRKGEAIWETSIVTTNSINSTSWFGNMSIFPKRRGIDPIILRGGAFNVSSVPGVFNFSTSMGLASNLNSHDQYTLRVVLI